MVFNKIALTFIVTLSCLYFHGEASAVDTETRIQREGPSIFKPSEGSRIERDKLKNCRDCVDKETKRKARYLERILLNPQSSEYQLALERVLFEDSDFVKNCWNKHVTSEAEVFFSVNRKGRAKDVAWFPKVKKTKCVEKYIKNTIFPDPPKVHHAWFLLELREPSK